jgi:hypothetical protein
MKTLGHFAYDAYLDFSGGASLVTGLPLPEWDKSDPKIQQAWEHVALAVGNEAFARRLTDSGELGAAEETL